MQRREALKSVALLLGTAISATTMSTLFESFSLPEHEKNTVIFSEDQQNTLADFSNIIIPDTEDAPGAKAAGVGAFIVMMLKDCYPAKVQLAFAAGLNEMENRSKANYGKPFSSLSIAEKNQLVGAFRSETIAAKQEKTAVSQFFTIARDLSILGYFSSEIGCTQARVYVPIPGRYDGEAPLQPGQKSWS